MHLRTATAAAVLTAALSVPPITAAHARPGGPDKDCTDFDTQLEAQLVLEGDPLDFFRLDVDEDGIACEMLPGTPVSASRPPTAVATPNAPATAAPPTPAPPTALPTGTEVPTGTALPLPTGTARPSGAPPAGVGGTASGSASGPADAVAPLGFALTSLAVAGGVVVLARRRAGGGRR